MRHGMSPRVYFGFRLPVWLVCIAIPLMLAHWILKLALRLCLGIPIALLAMLLRGAVHAGKWSKKPSRITQARRGMRGGH
jgi:hypothetical protein